MKTEAVVTTLLLAFVATTVSAQESTRKDFEEYCQTMQGRCVGELTLLADWQGIGNKGEKLTAYSESTVTVDGNALSSRFYVGNGIGEGMTVFDAGAKQIKGMTVWSGGTVFNSVVFKKDGKWNQVGTGSNPDGTKVDSSATLTIADDGDTLTWTRHTAIDGKEMGERSTSWRRAGK